MKTKIIRSKSSFYFDTIIFLFLAIFWFLLISYPSSYFNATNIKKVELAFHEYLGIFYSYIKSDI
ncbi:hypothetical protein CRU94_01405 [Arcobacter sp. AHV-9/2010]|nr:hypothetical protein CRU94_01405 [Arcobacter sp. CECT 9299]